MDGRYTLYQYLNAYCTDYNKPNNTILAKIYHLVMKFKKKWILVPFGIF